MSTGMVRIHSTTSRPIYGLEIYCIVVGQEMTIRTYCTTVGQYRATSVCPVGA